MIRNLRWNLMTGIVIISHHYKIFWYNFLIFHPSLVDRERDVNIVDFSIPDPVPADIQVVRLGVAWDLCRRSDRGLFCRHHDSLNGNGRNDGDINHYHRHTFGCSQIAGKWYGYFLSGFSHTVTCPTGCRVETAGVATVSTVASTGRLCWCNRRLGWDYSWGYCRGCCYRDVIGPVEGVAPGRIGNIEADGKQSRKCIDVGWT